MIKPIPKKYEIYQGDAIIQVCWITRNKKELIEENSQQDYALKPVKSNYLSEIEQSRSVEQKLITIIQNAERLICVSTFLISNKLIIKALLEAYQRGVSVYLLTSGVRLAEIERLDSDFSKEMFEEHRKILNELAGKILVRLGDHFHAKFILIDPLNEKKSQGFLLTANLTDEALERNKEIAVRLEWQEIIDLYESFCIAFWEESARELLEMNQVRPIRVRSAKKLSSFKGFSSNISGTTKKLQTLKNDIKDLIQKTDEAFIISSFGFDQEHQIFKLILSEVKNKRNLLVFTPPRQKIMPELINLKLNGARILAHNWHHAKALLVKNGEDFFGLVFTANIQTKGLDEGFEFGVKLFVEKAVELKNILEIWRETFPLELVTNIQLKDLNGNVKIWDGVKLEDFTIQELFEKDLGEIIADSVEKMDETKPLKFPNPPDNIKYKNIIYKWTVIPPKLPNEAKKIESTEKFPIYELRKIRYIVIQNENEKKDAIVLSGKLKAKIVIK